MLDKNGGPRPGLSIFPDVVTSDEEFSARAREIVDYTGSDQRAALNLIDHLGDELAEKMDRKVSEIEQAVEDEIPTMIFQRRHRRTGSDESLPRVQERQCRGAVRDWRKRPRRRFFAS